jgi:hypothetical protein
VNAKTPGGVRARSDYTALIGLAAHGKGFAAQAGVSLFFYGAKKCV